MLKTISLTLALMVASCTGTAYASCPSQIIIKPDGTMIVCYYCSDGKTVNCFNL